MSVSGLTQVAQRVDDLDRAVAFYRDVLGCTFVARFDPPGLAFFDLGGVRLLLEHGERSALLYLTVDDITSAHAELVAKGVEIVSEPHLTHRDDDGTFGPAGNETWMAFLNDSEGNLIAITEMRVSS